MMKKVESTNIYKLFSQCAGAIRKAKLIHRESRADKEFHFQNWVQDRLKATKLHYEVGGRNSYPDFRLVKYTEGFEVKGLAYPGREINYDCNSQPPTGSHNGRVIYYIFGRYPADPDDDSYPVLDLVICHGDFLNADHKYVHKNKSIKGFGTYGDIMIRDRKMYVAPTPFGLASGLAHCQTLILPEGFTRSKEYKQVGKLIRQEADRLIVAYRFDLKTNDLIPETIPNAAAGREHVFYAWRLPSGPVETVTMRETSVVTNETERKNRDE
jgi:hypothetical protein